MDRQELAGELQNLIAECLKRQGYELVELIHRDEGRDLFLRILADRPEGGISIGECSRINREICAMLDEKNSIEAGYILEVSSPGLDRLLKNKNDFTRCRNKRARFFLNQPVEEKLEIEGIIGEVKEDSLSVDLGGKIIELSLDKIDRAKQIIM